jgi:hypothetical protein
MKETLKITAILVAHVVGYSRLAGADEERTLARLRALRSDLRPVHRQTGRLSPKILSNPEKAKPARVPERINRPARVFPVPSRAGSTPSRGTPLAPVAGSRPAQPLRAAPKEATREKAPRPFSARLWRPDYPSHSKLGAASS